MKVSDILRSVNETLRETFNIDIHTKETTEGYDRPCFFVDLIPNSISQFNKHYDEGSYQILITYADTKREDETLYQIIEQMKALFVRRLKVGDRSLRITSFDYDFVGDNNTQLEFTINIQFMEHIKGKESTDIIQDINLDLEGE